jgi:hypothetical protein
MPSPLPAPRGAARPRALARAASVALGAITTLVAVSAPAVAAEAAMPAPQMFVVHVESVQPSKVAEYEATSKEFLGLLRDNRTLVPMAALNALQGEDLSYAYILPIRNLSDADAVNAAFEGMGKAVGEKRWMDLMHRNGATIAHVDESVFMEVPGASYWPADAKVLPQAAGYFQLDFYRVMPGMEDAAMEVATSWRALFEKAKLPYGYSVFRLYLGNDGPLWVVSTPAKDPADLAALQAASQQGIGKAAWQAQMAKTMAIARGFESKRYWARPDLSLPPVAGK